LVKHIHIERNVTLNTEPCPWGLTAGLSGWGHFSALFCFNKPEPLSFGLQAYTETLHRVNAPTMVQQHKLRKTNYKSSATQKNETPIKGIFKILQDFLNSVKTQKYLFTYSLHEAVTFLRS